MVELLYSLIEIFESGEGKVYIELRVCSYLVLECAKNTMREKKIAIFRHTFFEGTNRLPNISQHIFKSCFCNASDGCWENVQLTLELSCGFWNKEGEREKSESCVAGKIE